MSATLQNVDEVYPLTATQQGLLFHTLAEPSSGVYMNQVITPIHGELDVDRFQRLWDEVVGRHANLRTAFVWDGLDEPLQVVRSDVRSEWSHLDLTGLSESDQQRRLDEFLDEERCRGFDLAKPPLCRTTLVRTGSSSWKWVWSFHHLIADGWSANLILDELFARYADEGIELTRPASYRDFIAGYVDRDEAREEAYWRGRLAGFTEPHRLEVPGLPPDPGASGYEMHTIELGAAASRTLEETARQLNVTLNALFVGAWSLVLSRWTRSSDVVFGTTFAGRPASLPGVEHATGLFINTLPQRVQVPAGELLRPWLREVQRAQIETREYEQSSLASIQRWSDVEAGQPLFDSILVFENYPRREPVNRFGEIEIGERTHLEQSNYPLAVLVLPGDTIRIYFVRDRSAFSDAAIRSLGSQLRGVLSAMAADPDQRLASFHLTTEDDEAWLRRTGTGSEPAYPPTTIREMIREAASAAPRTLAAVDASGSITYEDLMKRADIIAARLAAVGVGPNRLVGLHLPRSTDLIAGIVGILEAGGAYVPLDPAYPATHVSDLLSDGGIDIVLTSSHLAPAIPDDVAVVLVDDETESGTVPMQSATPTDLAYVIHTSGSTGRPKGVMVTHENLVASTRARSEHYRGPVGSFLLLSSFAFDSSVVGIFWTLTTGGTLVLPAPDQEREVPVILDLARRHEVTHTLSLPSLYELLLESADEGQLDTLRVAIVAGEACPPRVLDAHRAVVPVAELHNEYGPTEGTVWCAVHRAAPGDDTLPIGRPIAGTRIFLLDDHGNAVPPGFAGEICIAGAGVVPGYLGRPDLTAERFVSTRLLGEEERIYRTGDVGAWRADGVLTYLGRADSQLKIRGHRIEPGAVEEAIRAQGDVLEAVVVGRSPAGRPGQQLVAYVVTDGTVDTRAMRDALRTGLPRHMVPDLIVPLDHMPRLPNGKVDLRHLPEPGGRNDAGFVPPRDDHERMMAKLWGELLGIEEATIGVHTDFFDAGGDSLVAIRLASAVHREFGESIPISALLDAPRLGEFTALLRDERPMSKLLVPIRGTGPDTVFMIHPGGGNVLVYEPIARHLPDNVRAIGVEAHGVGGADEPDRSVEQMAKRYAEAIDSYQPTGVLHLLGHSTGGLVALETARALTSRGRSIGVLAMLDTTFPPGKTIRDRLHRQLITVREGGYLGLRTVADWYWGNLRGAVGKLRHGPKWRYLLARGRPLPPELAGKRINQIAMKLHRECEPRPYAGTITYLRATGEDGVRFKPSVDLWAGVADEVVVTDTPGTHTGDDSMVAEPHARSAARIIGDAIAAHRPQGLDIID